MVVDYVLVFIWRRWYACCVVGVGWLVSWFWFTWIAFGFICVVWLVTLWAVAVRLWFGWFCVCKVLFDLICFLPLVIDLDVIWWIGSVGLVYGCGFGWFRAVDLFVGGCLIMVVFVCFAGFLLVGIVVVNSVVLVASLNCMLFDVACVILWC